MNPVALQSVSKTERTVSVGGHLPESSPGSVTNLIWMVKKGDAVAAQELFARYCRRLVGLAKRYAKDLRVFDEEDVVNSAFAGFFHGAKRGQYTQLYDRDDLWHLLVKITIHKAQKLVRDQERACRCHRRADVPIEEIADPSPPPDLEVLANETIQHFLSRLGSVRLRSIVVWKLEGYLNKEIAAMLGCSSRTIARKLELIRIIWNELDGR